MLNLTTNSSQIMKKLITIYILISIFLSAPLFGQDDEIQKQVRVTKAYQPVIMDADKIDSEPKYSDSTRIKPSFDYNLRPQQLQTNFEVRPIKPAKMVGVSLDKLYKTFIKAGLGNYFTPMAEVSVNNLRSREYSIAGYAYHKSSLSNLKLDNDDKVYAGYANNIIKIDAARFEKNVSWGGNAGITSNTYHKYGYNTNLFASDSLPEIKAKDIRNRFAYVHVDLFAKSAFVDSTRINYSVNAHLGRFSDNNKYAQNNASIEASSFKNFKNDFILGFDAGLHHRKSDDNDSSNASTIAFNPFFSKKSKDWSIRLGLKSVNQLFDGGKMFVYPDLLLQVSLIENVITPYAGARGDLQAYDYMNIVALNPFTKNTIETKYTDTKMEAFIGMKGVFNSKAFST
jgi:hypothetical protein